MFNNKEILLNFICSDKAKAFSKMDEEFLLKSENQKHFEKEERLFDQLLNSIPLQLKGKLHMHNKALLFILILQSEFYYLKGLQDCCDFALSLYERE